MKAGKTQLDVRTHVRITKIGSNDPEDQILVGVTGEITHPFPGLMVGSPHKYIAGLWIDKEHQNPHGDYCNLLQGDEVEVVTDGE